MNYLQTLELCFRMSKSRILYFYLPSVTYIFENQVNMNKNKFRFIDESKINSILKKKEYNSYNPAKFSITKTTPTRPALPLGELGNCLRPPSPKILEKNQPGSRKWITKIIWHILLTKKTKILVNPIKHWF